MRLKSSLAVVSLLLLASCASSGVKSAGLGNAFSQKQVTARGTDLHYIEGGSGPTLVLIGGWPQTSYSWRKVMPELARNHRVLAFDLPGQGNSGFATAYDTQTIAGYLHDALTQLGVSTHALVGHDVGAWVAYSYAANYPESLTHLVLMDAAIPGVTPDQAFGLSDNGFQKIFQFYWHAVPDLPEAMTKGREREYLDWFFKAKTVRKDAISSQDLDVYARAYARPGYMKAGFDYYRAFFLDRAQNQKSVQSKLPMPVLALGGSGATADHLLIALRPAAQNVSGGSIEGCGHYLQEECPQEVTTRILTFLKNSP